MHLTGWEGGGKRHKEFGISTQL